ncbi:MAG: ATP-binding cassette domain-containing protein [Bacteroidota bacterium]
MTPLLEVRALSLSFEGQLLFEELDFAVSSGELCLLYGPAASGKSSLLSTLMGLQTKAAVKGAIVLRSSEIQDLPTEKRVKAGLALIPENRPIFPELSVRDHLRLSQNLNSELLSLFPLFEERHAQLAGTLSGGEQAVLSVLMIEPLNPAIILWDMPLKGLAPNWVQNIFRIIRHFRSKGTALLMAVQNPADWEEFQPQMLPLGNL